MELRLYVIEIEIEIEKDLDNLQLPAKAQFSNFSNFSCII